MAVRGLGLEEMVVMTEQLTTGRMYDRKSEYSVGNILKNKHSDHKP
jgi:hypothetical protein